MDLGVCMCSIVGAEGGFCTAPVAVVCLFVYAKPQRRRRRQRKRFTTVILCGTKSRQLRSLRSSVCLFAVKCATVVGGVLYECVALAAAANEYRMCATCVRLVYSG